MLFLTFEDGKLVLMNDDDKVVATVESADDVVNALLKSGDESYLCSSSVDFPHGYTTDIKVVRLCHELRGKVVRES
jgi:hypothetical protein